MKLSEMTNKEAFRAIAKIMPIAKEILKDEKLLKIYFRRMELKSGLDMTELKIEKAQHRIDKIGDLVPYILEAHEKNVYKLLAILNNKTPKEVEKQGFVETFAQLTEALNDESLVKLFTM